MVIELNASNFKTEVLDFKGVVLVDFWASWCGPCLIMAPLVEELAKEYAEKIKIGKLDVEKNNKIVTTYNIMNIPTLIIFKNGRPVEQLVGLTPKETIKEKINAVLS